jgi:hypothetical protein
MLAKDGGIMAIKDSLDSHLDKPLLLDYVQRLAPVWKVLNHIPTNQVPDWFDAQVRNCLFCNFLRLITQPL